MPWIDSFQQNWSNVVTVCCLIIVGVTEALQEALSKIPATSSLPRLDGAWNYLPLLLLIIAGVSWIIGRFKPSRDEQPQIAQSIPPALLPGIPTLSALQGVSPKITFNPQDWFKFAYYSPLTAEVESNIKVVAHRDFPSDPESFYAKFIGIGVVAYQHDETWWAIYKSQLQMLEELNSRPNMPLSDAQKYYDQVVPQYPTLYPAYTFDQWMSFMRVQQLVVVHPSQMLEISHKGKDFLKYTSHWGRKFEGKRF